MAKTLIKVKGIGKLYSLSKGALSPLNSGCFVYEKGPKGAPVLWVGKESECPREFKKARVLDAKDGIVIPAFVDSHTHLVFAGDRSEDFERRLLGWSYQDIAKAGGGIRTTMTATRKASTQELLRLCQERVQTALEQGIGTIEIKTGYGLSFEAEKKCLDVITKLKKSSKATVKSTFLALHGVPPEFEGRRQEYVRTVTQQWLPKLKSQIDYVDIFLDEGYFDKSDAKEFLTSATTLGLPVKIHADELALSGGTDTAIEFGALSADHLLQIGNAEITKLSRSKVVATLLPATAFYLGLPYAPARKLLDAGARVALATDYNPGTAPSQDISLTALLAATQMKMKPEEILLALTYNGACALGLENKKGSLAAGCDADFQILPAKSLSQFFYEFGYRKIRARVFISGSEIPR